MPLVFQYGSNCDASRFNSDARLAGDAEDRGRAETINEYDVAFDVWSQSNGCAAADLITTPGRCAWGVLYKITDNGYEKLKGIEGSRYEPTVIRVRKHTGEVVDAITFLVRQDERRKGLWTSFQYVRHIVNGLRDHGAPEDWVARVIEVAINTNAHATTDATRAAEEIRLLKTLSKIKSRKTPKPARPTVVHVCGIPGSGKTAYCEWLERKKGFLHLDFDLLLKGEGPGPKLLLVAQFQQDPENFVAKIYGKVKPTVIDWGFPPRMLPLVRLFQEKGVKVWWFDGDREAARQSFAARGTVSMEAFQFQMRSIEQAWSEITKMIGNNVINTVTAGPTYASPEWIYDQMFRQALG